MSRATEHDASPDGRVRRGARNRERIIDAILALVGAGSPRPTAEEVALQAGVGTRTVFRHFADMERLHAELNQRIEADALPLLEQRVVDGPIEDRVRDLVAVRGAVFEQIAPYKRSGNIQRWRSPILQKAHGELARRMREHLLRHLPELGAAPALVDATELACSFEAWTRLREDQRLGRERAAATVEGLVLGLLRAAGSS